MDNKLIDFANWHGIDPKDGGSLLLAALENSDFNGSLTPDVFEEMGVKPGDTVNVVISKIRTKLKKLEMEEKALVATGDPKSGAVVAEISLITDVLDFLT